MGVAHSGTTILYRLLARHLELCWFSQFSQRNGNIPNRFDFPGSSLMNIYGRKFFSTPWKKKNDLSLYFIPRPMEAHKIWDYLLPDRLVKKESLSEKEIKDIRSRFNEVFYDEFLQWGRETIICKMPRLLQATDLLYDLLPNTKIIHLTRDGRAVSLSNINKFGQEDDERRKKLKLSAKHWKNEVEYMIENKNKIEPNDFIEIKLESLQGNFEVKFRKLLEFLNLDFSNYPKPLPEIRKNTNEKYKNKASKEDIKILESMLESKLKALSYNQSWLT